MIALAVNPMLGTWAFSCRRNTRWDMMIRLAFGKLTPVSKEGRSLRGRDQRQGDQLGS